MKLFVFGLLLIIANSLYGQSSNQGDCGSAVHLSDGDSISINPTQYGLINELFPGTVSNPTTNPQGQNSGCLMSGESRSNWCIITVCTSGNLAFSFEDTSGGFLDWIMWPYDSTTCFQILANSHPPIACNWNAGSAGLTGMADSLNLIVGAIPGNFEDEISVQAGEQYLICINSYTNIFGNIHFSSLGSAQLCPTPSSLPCSTFPILDTLITTPTTCGGSCVGEVNLNAISNADSVIYTVGGTSNYSGDFQNLCLGTYDVEIEDSSGCILYGSVFIQEGGAPISPTILTPMNYACDVFCDSISGDGLLDYIWFNNSTILSTQQTFLFCDSVPNEVGLTGIDLQGCPADSVYLDLINLVYGIELVSLSATFDTVAFGGYSEICAFAASTSLTYAWDTGDTGPCVTVYPIDSATVCVNVMDPCGRTVDLCYTVYAESNVSLDERSNTELILSYTQNGFSINPEEVNSHKECELTLIDSFGRSIYSTRKYALGSIIDTEELSSGLYYILIKDSNFSTVVKYQKLTK